MTFGLMYQSVIYALVYTDIFSFSPDGQLLAVGSDDGSVDFYSIRPGARLARAGYCKNISSAVLQLDWSEDSKLIKVSTCTCRV